MKKIFNRLVCRLIGHNFTRGVLISGVMINAPLLWCARCRVYNPNIINPARGGGKEFVAQFYDVKIPQVDSLGNQ